MEMKDVADMGNMRVTHIVEEFQRVIAVLMKWLPRSMHIASFCSINLIMTLMVVLIAHVVVLLLITVTVMAVVVVVLKVF